MSQAGIASNGDLARARQDPAFRHQLLANHLNLLLREIKKMRESRADTRESSQLREGVKLAVQLAEILQQATNGHPTPPKAS